MKLPRLTRKHPEDRMLPGGTVILRVVGREIKRWRVGGERIIDLNLEPSEARLLVAGLQQALEHKHG